MNNKRSILYALVFAVGLLNVSCDGSGQASGETILEPIQPFIVSRLQPMLLEAQVNKNLPRRSRLTVMER